MTYQIADAKTRYFNDKEHYLNFLQAWKKAATRSVSKGEDRGCLTAAHMLLYTLLRGRDARAAFTPVTKETKLRNGSYINHGMYWAYQQLDYIGTAARNDSEWQRETVKTFLAPFNGVLDKDVFIKITEEMPEISALYSNYGKGIAIAEALIETDERDSKVLWNIIEEGSK